MNNGTLSFYLNGKPQGIAYNNPKFSKGPIYPAVALFWHGGCIRVISEAPEEEEEEEEEAGDMMV